MMGIYLNELKIRQKADEKILLTGCNIQIAEFAFF